MMANQDAPAPRRPIQVELPAELEATYSNFAMISHSASETIVDFARVLPNAPKTKIYARIIMTPMNAKLLHRALGENLAKYEDKYGEIQAPNKGFDPPKKGFEPPVERMGFVRD
ncbi:MAG: DUF3467 domain-containing protein [Anaerolineaceae bacterium]|jgi:hypothetical protein|nr:DUF3467 domain-containing protein [Anaerolineae bacterium]MDX9833165.1 DUF3467 domain-containing protein [Anaerolineae bacterium]NLF12507.1 DUF3467 domain-containing protein [Anaerolineaceae bacterium]